MIKKPLDYVPIIHVPNFPKMPILYMELLENKKKVIPKLKNEEYIPKEVASTSSPLLIEAEKSSTVAENFRLDEEKNADSGEKLGIKFIKEGKGKKKGAIGIIDLSRMSADEISKMAANKASASSSIVSEIRKSSHQSPARPSQEHYAEAFPVSGRSLDENYHKTRLAGKSEALSQVSETPRSSESKRGSAKSYFTEEPAAHRFDRSDRRDRRNDREQKYQSQSHDWEEKYRHSDRRDKSELDDREDFFRMPSGRDQQPFDSPYEKPETLRTKNREEEESKTQDGGLSDLITTSASGLRLEDVLSGNVASESKKTNKTTPPGQSSASIGLTTAAAVGAGVAAAAVGMNGGRPTGQRPAVAPSLTQIQQGTVVSDKNGVRDVKYATAEEVNEETKKQNLLFKFKILKRTYKEATIPEFSDHTPLNTLQREYDSIVRQLALDATVENYKKYLTIGFFVLEFVVANMFHLEEIRGFATQQMVGMNQYEKTLYLLGEQSALSGNKPLPPIVQLIIAIMINGAIYVGSKMLFRSTGTNIMSMLGGLGGQNTGPSPQQQHQPGPQGFAAAPPTARAGSSKPRMHGPSISLEEITGKKSV